MDLFDIGEAIRSSRKAQQMTQAELAEKAGISRPRLNQLESGAIFDVRFGTLIAVLTALDLDVRLVSANGGRPTLDELQVRNDDGDDIRPGF
jgi:transcriptional regulator with XRE-family HTH domain